MTGWIRSGNRCDEKKTPDTTHIGITVRLTRPDSASIVRARDPTSTPSELKHSDPSTQSSAIDHHEPRIGTSNASAPNASGTTTSTGRRMARQIRYDSRYCDRDIGVAS